MCCYLIYHNSLLVYVHINKRPPPVLRGTQCAETRAMQQIIVLLYSIFSP